jgi:hypothetical protein
MRLITPILAVATRWTSAASAQPTGGTEVSKEIENPVTRRITLPLRYEAD